MTVAELIKENKRRRDHAPYDPYSGEGAPLERRWLVVEDFYLPAQYVPTTMFDDPLVIGLSKAGSISKYLKLIGEDVTEETAAAVKNMLIQVRGSMTSSIGLRHLARSRTRRVVQMCRLSLTGLKEGSLLSMRGNALREFRSGLYC